LVSVKSAGAVVTSVLFVHVNRYTFET
jgi:hypothetical protein